MHPVFRRVGLVRDLHRRLSVDAADGPAETAGHDGAPAGRGALSARDQGPCPDVRGLHYGLKNVSSRPADITPIQAASETPPTRRAANGGAWCSAVNDSRRRKTRV